MEKDLVQVLADQWKEFLKSQAGLLAEPTDPRAMLYDLDQARQDYDARRSLELDHE